MTRLSKAAMASVIAVLAFSAPECDRNTIHRTADCTMNRPIPQCLGLGTLLPEKSGLPDRDTTQQHSPSSVQPESKPVAKPAERSTTSQ